MSNKAKCSLSQGLITLAAFSGLMGTSYVNIPSASAAPGGSYTQTCIGIQESQYPNGRGGYTGRLSAQCRDRQGRVTNAYLDNYNACQPNTITNINGTLRCRYR